MSTLFNKVRLLTPGPTEIPDRVRLAMAQPMIHHRKPEFKTALSDTQILLKQLFGTQEVVLPLAASGTGAMTAAVHNLFHQGEKVLVINAGKFGERWGKIAKSHGLNTYVHTIEWGKALLPEELVELLKQHPDAKGVLLQISETSTGVQLPIQELAAVTRNTDVLLVADGISAVGISPCPMDEWGIDCLITGSQKGLMVPPGLSLIALSKRAWQKAESVTNSCFYFNLPKEKENCLKNQTLFTSPVSLILGLREGLNILFENGLTAVYEKQWALTSMARTGIQNLNLTLAAPTHYAWGVTSVFMPKGQDSRPVVKHMYEKYGVIITAGQDPMEAEMLRIGHMGWIDWADMAAGLYALAESMHAIYNHPIPKGYLENAISIAFNPPK